MCLNAAKCKVMHIGYHNSKHTFEISDGSNSIPLSKMEIEKDLGAKVDNQLTFSDRIQQADSKANGMLGIF